MERTRDAVTEEEDGGRVGEGAVGQNGLALVVSKTARGMTIRYLPLSVRLHDGVVGDDLYVFRLLFADQFREDSADEGGHSTGNARVRKRRAHQVTYALPGYNHDGDVVRFAKVVEFFEPGVETDVCGCGCSRVGKRVHGIIKDGLLFLSTSLHSSKVCPLATTLWSMRRNSSLAPSVSAHASFSALMARVPEGLSARQDLEVALPPLLHAVAKIVGHVCIMNSHERGA